MMKQLTIELKILVVLLSGVLTTGAWEQNPPEVRPRVRRPKNRWLDSGSGGQN